MHSLLNEINQLYLPYETISYYTGADIRRLSEQELEDFKIQMTEYCNVRQIATEKFLEAAPQLSPSELVEGYAQACRTLKQHIGGYMYLHFEEEYRATMIQAVADDDDAVYLFLGALRDHLSREDFVPILLTALKKENSRTLEAALFAIGELGVLEAVPDVVGLIESPIPEVAGMAKKALDDLRAARA